MQLRKNFFLFFFLSLFLLVGGCGKKGPVKRFYVGVDPSFFPLELKGQSVHLFAFTNELLQEIGKVKHVELVRVNASWDNLLEGLQLNKYQAALSCMPITRVNCAKYAFSEPFLQTGPVLVVPKESEGITLEKLERKVIAIEKKESQLELMSQYPNIEFIFYDRFVDTLESVSKGLYSGTLVPILLATRYVRDIFHGTLAISSEVLTDEGIRLVTCKDACPELIAIFDEGLDILYNNGTYDALLKKWNLDQP